MAKPRKQKSAAQIEAERIAQRAQDMEAVNIPKDAAILPRQADIQVTRKGMSRESDKGSDQPPKKVDVDEGRRLDAFSALRTGMARGAYDAARRLERDIIVMLGLNERGMPSERLDGDPPKTDRTDAMCAAKGDVEAVMERMPPRDGWLLTELIAPPIDRGTWRDHVAYVTGERHDHGQSAAVRACCVNLRDAYTAIERRAA